MTPPLSGGRRWPRYVDLIVFDFDGVMTDNTVWVNQDGTESVRCHRGDGLGISRIIQAGFRTVILSTETNPVVAARAAKLQIPVVQGCEAKGDRLRQLIAETGAALENTVYLGNDDNDLECMHMAGLPVAVADAEPAAAAAAHLILDRQGGHGAVRELCDLLLRYTRPSSLLCPTVERGDSLAVGDTWQGTSELGIGPDQPNRGM